MINLNTNQELAGRAFINPNSIHNWTSKEKHAYTEQKMGDRIRLPYDQAVKACKYAINSDEKLIKAFKNFQENKYLQFYQVSEEVLLAAFVDKFKEKIFFVSFKGGNIYNADNLYHYVYDVPSKQLSSYSNNDRPSNLSNIVEIIFKPSSDTLIDSWRRGTLTHHIHNENTQNENSSMNQKYVSDEDYFSVIKNFQYIKDIESLNYHCNEENLLSYGTCISSYNPAHTMIDPDDLIHERILNSKKARTS